MFAGDRAGEFAARMRGERYDGGGIASTVAATRAADDATLRALLAGRIAELRAQGTTTVEIKSGYGLTVADEERALRLAAEVTPETTFLGAPTSSPPLRPAPSTSPWSPARCSPPARRTPAGSTSSASPRARTPSTATRPARCSRPGARRGWACGCTATSSAPARGSRWPSSWARRASTTARTSPTPTSTRSPAATPSPPCCPGVEFSTRSPYPDARRLLDAGVPLALATDCNPGTCASSSMPLMIALAVREMGLTPDEALHAATAGAARALRRADVGVVAPGRRADLTVLDAPSHLHLAYRPGVPLARALDLGAT